MVGLFSCNSKQLNRLSLYLKSIPSSEIPSRPITSRKSPESEHRHQKIAQAEVDLILERYKDGDSTRTIAVDLGRSRTAISGVLKRAGVEIRTLASPTKAQVDEMIRLYIDERLSLESVGERVGFSTKTIYNYLRKEGVQMRSPQGT